MKITAVKTVVVNAKMRNWVFVKIETDQPGLVGWGEASIEWKTRAVVGCVEDLSVLLIGQDPERIEHLCQVMLRHSFWRYEIGLIGMSAISGIEMALWDILGKSLGVPVYKLLGGRVRDRVRMYTHLGGGNTGSVYETFSAEVAIDLAHQSIAKGYTAVKVVFVPFSEALTNIPAVKKFAGMVGQLRAAIGDEIDLMIDFHGRTSPGSAVYLLKAIEEFRPYFCEEVVPAENIDALLSVKEKTFIPLATGERRSSRHGFREIIEKNAVHVIQPDLCHCGGLSEAKKIAAHAETHYMGVAPHNPLGPVANAAALHFALSTPNFLIQEDMLEDVPWRWEVVQSQLKTENGYWLPCEAPGLGIEVDEVAAVKHPFQQEIMQTVGTLAHDGAVLDW
jgi:galactonate dehydratase